MPKSATAKPEAAKKKKSARKREEEKLKQYNRDFLADVALQSEQSLDDTRKFLCGLRKALLNTIRNKGVTRVPNVCVIRVQKIPARPEREKNMFGTVKKLAPQPEQKRVKCSALKQFKTAAL